MSIIGELIPIALFVCITIGILAALYWNARIRAEQQETLRQVIATGQELDETVLKLMVKAPNTAEMDLRTGIISIMMGLGFCVAGGIGHFNGLDSDFAAVMLVIGTIIGFTGAGQMLSWHLRRRAAASTPANTQA